MFTADTQSKLSEGKGSFPSLPVIESPARALAEKIRRATQQKTNPLKIPPLPTGEPDLPFAEGVLPVFASLLKESLPTKKEKEPRNEIPEDMFDPKIPKIESLGRLNNAPEWRELNEQEEIDLWVDRFANACEQFPEKRDFAILAATLNSKPAFRDRLIPVIVALQKKEAAKKDPAQARILLEELGATDSAHRRFYIYSQELGQIAQKYEIREEN